MNTVPPTDGPRRRRNRQHHIHAKRGDGYVDVRSKYPLDDTRRRLIADGYTITRDVAPDLEEADRD